MPNSNAVRGSLPLLLVVLACGCGGSTGSEPQAESVPPSAPSTSGEQAPPRSVDELLERLPPFDEPASPEVDAYRRAAIGAFYDRCVSASGAADKETFVHANTELLDRTPVFPGAQVTNEFSIDHRDGNGCPEAIGPATSYTTYRNYRLPKGTQGRKVTAYYRRELTGWTQAGASGDCELSFTRGEALFAVRACSGSLSLIARALERQEPPPLPALPPRPTGDEYPETTEDYRGPTEPSGYEVQAGDSCERGQASGRDGVVPIILPPSPGVRAILEDEPFTLGNGTFEQSVAVEWWFEKIHGDCPPTRLHLTLVNPNRTMPPLSLPFDVRARSGAARLPVLEHFAGVTTLLASVESVDGTRSRSVAVLIRR